MTKKFVRPDATDRPYSAAVVAGDYCFVSGQGSLDPISKKKVEGGIGPETAQALENTRQVLGTVGFSLADVVSVTVYLLDMDEWSEMNSVYRQYFPEDPPARAAVAVRELPMGIRVEIQSVAWRGSAS